jgi:hypothetical protein
VCRPYGAYRKSQTLYRAIGIVSGALTRLRRPRPSGKAGIDARTPLRD